DRAPCGDDQPGRPRRPPRRRPRRCRRNARRAAAASRVPTGTRLGPGRVVAMAHESRTSLRVVLREFRPFRRDGYEALLGISIAVVAQVTAPLVVAYAINKGVTEHDTSVIAVCTAVMAVLVAAQVGGTF